MRPPLSMAKLVLFLGAGASVPFEMPTTRQMKHELYTKCDDQNIGIFFRSLLDFYGSVDVEHVLQFVNDVYSFFMSGGGNYYTQMFGESNIKIKHYDGKETYLPINLLPTYFGDIKNTIESEILRRYAWNPKYNEKLLLIYDSMINRLREKFSEIRIATTNYDRAIEEYCVLKKYFCIDGFERNSISDVNVWKGQFRDDRSKDSLILYKLHGSLNWKRHVQYDHIKTEEEGKSSDPKIKENLVIYPTISPKNGVEFEPYMTVRKHFDDYLKSADACLVIGFSFRDQHINELFNEFISSKKPFVVLSPDSMEHTCQNLLKVDVPQGYDRTKISSMAPINGKVWCIPSHLNENEIKNYIDVACIHLLTP